MNEPQNTPDAGTQYNCTTRLSVASFAPEVQWSGAFFVTVLGFVFGRRQRIIQVNRRSTVSKIQYRCRL